MSSLLFYLVEIGQEEQQEVSCPPKGWKSSRISLTDTAVTLLFPFATSVVLCFTVLYSICFLSEIEEMYKAAEVQKRKLPITIEGNGRKKNYSYVDRERSVTEMILLHSTTPH